MWPRHFLGRMALSYSNIASVDDEGCLLLVGLIHMYLVVSRESIHEGEELMHRCRVYKESNLGQWKTVLGVCFVEIGEIDTHSPFFAGLFDQNDIGQPFWIVCFSDKSGL
jgi:hypothetical protein